jgi:hypothetical protein
MFLKNTPDFFFSRKRKLYTTKLAEEYCWAITEVVGPSCFTRSGSSVLDFEFQLDALIYKYIW